MFDNFDWTSWLGFACALGIALVASMVVIIFVTIVARTAGKHRDWPRSLIKTARYPFRALVLTLSAWAATATSFPEPVWRPIILQAFLITTIAIGAWFVGAMVSFTIGLGMARYRTDIPDNKVARRMQTQLAIVRRLAMVVIVILAIGSILLTFPGVQAVGTSVLASAGVVSIVAGLAAQSALANVFAGVQLAFSDAIRVQDVVIADGEWGRIEEITLTYVVVHIWDDRRMVLPSTYFTTQPFQNWTRNSAELVGSVELDLDWRVSPAAMREELDTILARTPIWDGRTAVLQVTDAVGGQIRVRVLVTAVDAPTLFDLRCRVREELVEWVQVHSAGLPRQRVEIVSAEVREESRATPTGSIGLFTGNSDAERRASNFTSSIPVQRGTDRVDER
ncbi:MAG: mechanosensitive ion channel family protein [Microbacteriaceae bacterium]